MTDKTEPADQTAEEQPKPKKQPVLYVLLQGIDGVGRKGEIHPLPAAVVKSSKFKTGEHYRKATDSDLAIAGRH